MKTTDDLPIQIKLKTVIAAWRAVKNNNTLAAVMMDDLSPPLGSQDRKDFVCVVTYLWPIFKYKKDRR